MLLNHAMLSTPINRTLKTQLFFTMTGLLGVGVRPMLWPTYVSHSHKTDVVGLVRCSVKKSGKNGGVGWLAFWRLAR
jgi:hypothetical protein